MRSKRMATKEVPRETVFRQNTLTGVVLRGISLNTSQKISTAMHWMVSSITIPAGRLKILPRLLPHGRQRGASRNLKRLVCRQWGLTVNYANCLVASALLMSLTSASRLHAPPQTVVILRCISACRAGQMSRAIVRLSGSPVVRRMTLTSTRKKSREWSAFTRRISARVIFISPERRTGALCRKFRSWSL